jgi:hypothetical protein
MSVSAFKQLRINTKTGVVSLAIALFMSVLLSGVLPVSAAVTFNSARDCDSNAVIHCGAMSTGELVNKYNANPSAQAIFSWFGISSQSVQNMHATAAAGKVTKNGEVLVNGKVVANNAVTAGRHNITRNGGSTKVVHNGVTFYVRAPHVSFRSNSLDAFVVLNKDGQFVYAVLASCANPVKARNVVPAPKPEKKPEVKKPVEEKKPEEKKPEVKPEVKPEKKPEKKEEVKPAPKELPKTGPAAAAGYFIGTSLLGTAAHAVYSRRRKS